MNGGFLMDVECDYLISLVSIEFLGKVHNFVALNYLINYD